MVQADPGEHLKSEAASIPTLPRSNERTIRGLTGLGAPQIPDARQGQDRGSSPRPQPASRRLVHVSRHLAGSLQGSQSLLPHHATGVGCPAWGADLIPRESNGFQGDAQAARSADPSPLQPTRFGVPDVRALRQERGEEAGGSLPRFLSNADARLTVTTGGRSRRHRRSAGNSSRCSCTWHRFHHNRLLYRCCPGPPSKSSSFRSCSIACWSCRASQPPAACAACIACIASVSSLRTRPKTRPVQRPRG